MYRLIIADDEFLVRDGLIQCVDWNALGYEIVGQFEDGEDVIAYISEKPVDVIFTDVKMFYISGLEVAQWVVANQPSVKVVFVSGYKEFDYVKKAMELGVCDYVLKPIEIDEIIRVFSKIKQELDGIDDDSRIRAISNVPDSENIVHIGGEQAEVLEFLPGKNGAPVSDDYIVERARIYVEKHLGEDFSLDDVAGYLYLSKSHFSREFKRLTGVSFMSYVIQRRMEKAIELINSGMDSPGKIAKAVGYIDIKYFQKCFKKHAGCSIREYQRMVRLKEE